MDLELSITEQCNLRCDYCYYKDAHGERRSVMSDEVAEASIRLALERSVEYKHDFLSITFFGGEPLLRMDFIKRMVKFTKKLVSSQKKNLPKGFWVRFVVNTNGTLLNDGILAYFKKEKFSVSVSLDGPERKQNLSRRTINGKGSFKAIAPHIPALVKMNVSILMVVTQKHVKGLANSIKWIFKQGFTSVASCLDFNGKWTGADFDNLIVEYEKLARFWYKLKLEKKDFYLSTIQDKVNILLLKSRHKDSTCFITKDSFAVSANGNVFPCTRFISSQKNAPYIMGNVLDENCGARLRKVPKDIRFFMGHDKKECDGCAIRYRCLAHECGCTSFYTTGSLEGISPEVCTHERILCAICDEYAEKLLKKVQLGKIQLENIF